MKRRSEAIAIVERVPRANTESLEALVQQRVAEALAARDEFVFEPFFRSRQVAYEMKRLQTVPERKKWSAFYARHGCLACHTRDESHASNGLCSVCHGRVSRQLKGIMAELMG